MDKEKLTKEDRKRAVNAAVARCHEVANEIIRNWKPLNSAWAIIDGCVYIRLSTDEQVIVERGSLEQQIFIAVSEAIDRSKHDQINYRISRFYIEPGITARNDRRPIFQEMKHKIANRMHGFIVIKEISRLSRELGIWKEFFNLCIKSECRLFIRGLPFDPNNPGQILQLDIIAAIAQYESGQTSKRLKESLYSALTTSQKFNATQSFLGLDPLIIDGDKKSGFFSRNSSELETVEEIMRIFLRYSSIPRTLEELKTLGILNKNKRHFTKASLVTLLKNRRYIGEWILNAKNRNKNENQLAPYERYKLIQLPHGCLISRDLWEQVQKALEANRRLHTRNTKVKRVFLLQGILRCPNDTPFQGGGVYYYNRTQKLRISKAMVEGEAKKLVLAIIKNSNILKAAIQRKTQHTEKHTSRITTAIDSIKSEISGLQEEKRNLNKRIDALLIRCPDSIEILIQEQISELNRINSTISEKQESIRTLETKMLQPITNNDATETSILKSANRVLEFIHENDPVALKKVYRDLFKVIMAEPAPTEGIIKLHFAFQNAGSGSVTDWRNGLELEENWWAL